MNNQAPQNGIALAALVGGQVVAHKMLADVSPEFASMMRQPGAEVHEEFFAKQVLRLPAIGPVVRELQALGEVSVGRFLNGKFEEL